MASKEECHFTKLIGIWTKLCRAKATFIVARESPIAVFGWGEVRDSSHAQVYALSNFLDGSSAL